MSDSHWKDQYKHPNWQKKRLEALDSAGFSCQSCFSCDDQLHVHHKRYVKGRKVWEYDLSELMVLCESCHEEEHFHKSVFDDFIARLNPGSLAKIVGLSFGFADNIPYPLFCDDLSGLPYASADERDYLLGRISASLSRLCRQELEQIADVIEEWKEHADEPVSLAINIMSRSEFEMCCGESE